MSKILSDAKSKALSNMKDAAKIVRVYVDVRLRKRLYKVVEKLAIFLLFTCLNFDFSTTPTIVSKPKDLQPANRQK